MKCNKCGAQIPEGAAFCGGCGSPVEKTKKKLPTAAIGIAIAIVLVIVIAVVAILLFGKKGNNETVSTDATVVGDAATGDGTIENGPAEVNPAELTPLYNITDVATIDIYAQNYVPGTKQEGIKWDSTLFYWLEDIDRSSSEDGYLSRCKIGKTMLCSAETGQLIQYEIYCDPNTSEIYKIVSIEQAAEGWKITDYYYSGGKPNFIFVRHDSVYTPTYATTDKTGERFYFHQDVLARWRMIRVPGEIGEYVLTPTENVWYSQANYFTETAEVQQAYNNIELRMLNAAYNTFNAVSAQSVGILEGKVQDTTGTGLGNLTVDVLRKADNALMYRGTTAEDGTFRILTYLDNSECYILIRGNETYKEAAVYGIFLADSGITNAYNNLLLHKVGGDEYPVHINVYSAADVRTGEDGALVKNLLAGSKVSVRAGVGAYTGEVLLTAEADAEGRVHANLQSGSYTLQIETPGYSVSYLEVEVAEQETTVEGYLLPALQEDKTGIVLTWDGADVDLDLTLFTPYQSTGGDMAHIGSTITDDGHGNQLLADNGAGCEVMYVNTAELGNYKLYVNNYTDSQSGNYNSNVLGTLNVHIYIYDINGFVAEYSFPIGQTGVVWEVVDISGKQFTPSNRVYNQIEGKSWWMESKEFALETLIQVLCGGGDSHLGELLTDIAHGYIYDGSIYNEADIPNTINKLFNGQPEEIMEFWGINTEVPDHHPPIETYFPADFGVDWKSYVMSKEQMEYAAYSLTGKHISFDSIASDLWIDGAYVGFGGCAGDITWNELRNFSVDFIGNNAYRVGADVWYFCDSGNSATQEEWKVGTITFLLKGNADSCYDGFSLLAVESVDIETTEWKTAYREFISEMFGDSSEIQYSLIHLNNDGVCELLVERDCIIDVYTYDAGNVYKMIDGWSYGTWGSYYGYLPYSNAIYEFFYSFLEDNTYHTLCTTAFYPLEYVNGVAMTRMQTDLLLMYTGDTHTKYELNGNDITQEQYDEYLRPYKDLVGDLGYYEVMWLLNADLW